MISIDQETRLDHSLLGKLLDKHGNKEYILNKQLIEDDIQKISTKYGGKKEGKIRGANTKAVLGYLNKLKERADKTLNIRWELQGNKISSIPVTFRRLAAYNVQITDYIVRDNRTIVCSDYTDVLNAIAYYMTFVSQGKSLERIEEVLNNVGLTVPCRAEEFKSMINPITYEAAKILKPVKSQFVDIENLEMYTYFLSEPTVKLGPNYKEVLDKSYNIVISFITQYILKNFRDRNYNNIKIASVYDNSIYFVIEGNPAEGLMDLISECVLVKIFGRNFEVSPEIQLY